MPTLHSASHQTRSAQQARLRFSRSTCCPTTRRSVTTLRSASLRCGALMIESAQRTRTTVGDSYRPSLRTTITIALAAAHSHVFSRQSKVRRRKPSQRRQEGGPPDTLSSMLTLDVGNQSGSEFLWSLGCLLIQLAVLYIIIQIAKRRRH